VVRSESSPREALPQCLHGAEEIEDILLTLCMLGEPYRAYFNSNRGADDSQSGSSVNHWHFQVFSLDRPSPLTQLQAEVDGTEGGLRFGRVPDWPARHVFVEADSSRCGAAARFLWARLRTLNEWNVAYNLEVIERGGGRFISFLFPRAPGAPIRMPDGDTLSPNFGGWELSGDIVVPTRGIFEWIRSHPREALEITKQRLHDTTRASP
jgi:hypothetical protein